MLAKLSSRIKSCKNLRFLGKATLDMRVLMLESGLVSEDSIYKKKFDKFIGSNIHKAHINENFICCTFCINLKKSNCHENCFKCRQGSYEDCSTLLPGTFSFKDSHFDALIDGESVPWIFRTPCTNFERIDKSRYFKNFISPHNFITVANFEALEGIFTGISRNKRPCHICASVNLDIYKMCSKIDKVIENTPCCKIINEIAAKYHAISGMIKYVE